MLALKNSYKNENYIEQYNSAYVLYTLHIQYRLFILLCDE